MADASSDFDPKDDSYIGASSVLRVMATLFITFLRWAFVMASHLSSLAPNSLQSSPVPQLSRSISSLRFGA
ncbi:hypothetical protein BDZ89DRAFT_1059525 [Hymenopellis radicata]|nr:hypothetical protein BDZ89DRAFT_1059525 [Hymenopellis radicata]